MWKIETLIKWTEKQYQSVDGGRKRFKLHACTFLHFWLSAVSERTSTSVRYQIDHRSSMFRDYAAWNYTFKWSERSMLAAVLWFNKSMILIYCRSLLQSSRSIREVASRNQFSVKSSEINNNFQTFCSVLFSTFHLRCDCDVDVSVFFCLVQF